MLALIGIICFGFGLFFFIVISDNIKGFIACIVFVIGILSWVASVVISSTISETKEEYKLVESHNIIALQDSSNTSGTFFLGCGTVGSSMYYCYYIDTDDGYKYQQIKVSSDDVDVSIKYCKEKETPHIEKYDEYKITTCDKNWGWLIDFKLSKSTESQSVFSPQKIIIYLPEGTIAENYKIDLQ